MYTSNGKNSKMLMYILQSFKTHKPLLLSTCSAFLPLCAFYFSQMVLHHRIQASSHPWLRCPLLCSPYTSSGTPGTFLFPRLCALFKTKFLGLLRKPLLMSLFRVLSILKLCCNKGSEVGQGVRMACEMNPWTEWQGGLNGRDFHPEYHSVG